MTRLIDLTGQRFGRLVVLQRVENLGSQLAWLVQCDCGNTATVRGEKLRGGRTQSCGCLRVETTRELRSKPVVDYAGAHARVVALHGPAKTHPCVDCARPAQEWSYDHTDPAERIGLKDYGRGLPYSLDPAHYQPRCKSCHTKFDARQPVQA